MLGAEYGELLDKVGATARPWNGLRMATIGFGNSMVRSDSRGAVDLYLRSGGVDHPVRPLPGST